MKIFVLTDEPALKTALAAALSAAEVELTDEPEAADVTLLDMPPDFNYDAMAAAATQSKNIVLWGRSITPAFAFQSAQIGVRGFVSKLDSAEKQAAQVRRAGQGELAWPHEIVIEMLTPAAQRVHLTRREGELITLVCRGLANKEIAYRMKIVEGTVKQYLSRLFDKLHIRSRHELAMFGMQTFGKPLDAAAPLPAPVRTVLLPAAA